MLLPRPHVSYSSMSLWDASHERFRKRYYEKGESFSTIQTRFGSKIHKEIEDNYGEFRGQKIQVGDCPEYEVRVFIDGVPVLAKIDSFFSDTNFFKDFKTGHADKNGKLPWDDVKVRKLKQLPFYAVIIDEHKGLDPEENSYCALDWLMREWIVKMANEISEDYEKYLNNKF